VHQFDEHHPELKGFSDFYAAEILPALEDVEAVREAAQSKANWFIFLGVILGAVVLFALIGRGVNLILIAIIAAIICSWINKARSSIYNPIQMRVKDLLVGGICHFLGWRYSEAYNGRPAAEKFSDMRLIPQRGAFGYNRAHFEDLISGQAKGYDFELFEACLEYDDGDDRSVVFQGQLISLGLKNPVSSTTVILRNGFLFNPGRKGRLKRVGIVDPVFEKIFTAYGTDQVEARVLLAPDIIQACVDLERSLDGQNIRFGFTNGTLLIAIETENRFEIGALADHITLSHRTHQIVKEIGAIFDLLDAIGNIDRG
jgi:hypothetical protein